MKIVLKDYASRLRALHHGPEMLVLPNAWDASSARLFAELGFPVIATSSRAVAASLGYADHEGAPREEMLAAAARIARAVDVPVTADAEAGYGLPAEDLVGRLLDAGIAGLNIEDSDHQAGTGLIDAARQADRLAAIKEAGRSSGVDLVVNARIDVFLYGGGDVAAQLAAAYTRAHVYAEAGADCVFPIGLRDSRAIEAFVQDIGVPVNILSYPGVPPLEELTALGVARGEFRRRHRGRRGRRARRPQSIRGTATGVAEARSHGSPLRAATPVTGTLQPGVVQVSFEPLDAPPPALRDLLADLTPEERERAGRLLADDRRRFVAARAGLRHRLGALLNQRPPEVAIRRRRGGKPELAGPRPPALHFSLSHTADLAVYAIALDRPVGIDVETTRSIGPARAPASRYFSAAEAELVRRAPAERASHLFLRLWVRKEALLKATGTGIAGRLRTDVAAAVGIHQEPAAQRLIMLPSPGGWRCAGGEPAEGSCQALVRSSPPEYPDHPAKPGRNRQASGQPPGRRICDAANSPPGIRTATGPLPAAEHGSSSC